MKKVADALLRVGKKNVPEDNHLVYVNDYELGMLENHSGKGEPDPITGIPHFDTGDDGMDSGSMGMDTSATADESAATDAATAASEDASPDASYDVGPAYDVDNPPGKAEQDQALQDLQDLLDEEIGRVTPEPTARTEPASRPQVEESRFTVNGRQALEGLLGLVTSPTPVGAMIGAGRAIGSIGRENYNVDQYGPESYNETDAQTGSGGRGGNGGFGGNSGGGGENGATYSSEGGSEQQASDGTMYPGGSATFNESQGPRAIPTTPYRPVWNDYIPMPAGNTLYQGGSPTFNESQGPSTPSSPQNMQSLLSALQASGLPADAIDYLMQQEKQQQIVRAIQQQQARMPATAAQIPQLNDYLGRR